MPVPKNEIKIDDTASIRASLAVNIKDPKLHNLLRLINTQLDQQREIILGLKTETGNLQVLGNAMVAGYLVLTAETGDGSIYERGRTIPIGVGIDVAYAAGNFTASGAGGWQVQAEDQIVYRYSLVGKMLTVAFLLETTSVTAPLGPELRIAIPGGFIANRSWVGSIIYQDSGGQNTASSCYVVNGATYIICQTPTHTNWSAAVDTTLMLGSITLEVQ